MAHFATKSAALDSARGMANLMGSMHYDADVMVEDNGLHYVWSYGQDKLISPGRRTRKKPQLQPLPRDHSLTVQPNAA
jgi:hypothetical protein